LAPAHLPAVGREFDKADKFIGKGFKLLDFHGGLTG
jgi:hypothetical protein